MSAKGKTECGEHQSLPLVYVPFTLTFPIGTASVETPMYRHYCTLSMFTDLLKSNHSQNLLVNCAWDKAHAFMLFLQFSSRVTLYPVSVIVSFHQTHWQSNAHGNALFAKPGCHSQVGLYRKHSTMFGLYIFTEVRLTEAKLNSRKTTYAAMTGDLTFTAKVCGYMAEMVCELKHYQLLCKMTSIKRTSGKLFCRHTYVRVGLLR